MGVLIDLVRIKGFRGLSNVEISLGELVILTGINNVGKTSFLKALQAILGRNRNLTKEDFYISSGRHETPIKIDIRIIPFNEGKRTDNFDEEWEILFTDNKIVLDESGRHFVPLRLVIKYEELKDSCEFNYYILKSWPEFKDGSTDWFSISDGKKTNFYFQELPYYYVNAQRDIIGDINMRNSHLSKMLSSVEYDQANIDEIENQIDELNKKIVSSSEVLSNIIAHLKDLDTTIDQNKKGVDITPFAKKIRDLNKNISIEYADFSMDYHGMGTRSWASLLTLKALISLLELKSNSINAPFTPILAIEEPESHLHPNAQRKLYSQLKSIKGQKIISTHSPYIAAAADLQEIRGLYKENEEVICSKLDVQSLSPDEQRKINREVLNTRGDIFFSKLIVFMEGETEEQSLPVFAEKYFKQSRLELGIDFIGVNGCGGYSPFLKLANSLNIPWFIYSDSDHDTVQKVKDQVKNVNSDENNIVFLNEGNFFEKELIENGYIDEIKIAWLKMTVESSTKSFNDKAKEELMKTLDKIEESEWPKKMKGKKTRIAPYFALEIANSTNNLPPSIICLFDKIGDVLNKQN